MRSPYAVLQHFLRSPWLPLVLAALAMLLTLPALAAGLALDDYYQRYTLLGRADLPALPSLWRDNRLPFVLMKLFSFAEDDPVSRWQQNDLGLYPWWTPVDGYVAFWRPLSAFTHWLDYQLWPHAIGAMHLHSILWFGLGIGVTTAFYRRIMGPTAVAGLAALLFALDDAHGLPVAWLANRNGVIAFCLGMITLYSFVQWRQSKQRRAGTVALLCFGLALLAAEAGVAALPYLVAYLLVLDRETIASRVRAFAPFLLLFLLWLTIHRLLGYGERGTGLYLDPLSAPLYFLRMVGERLPILLLSQWVLPPAGLYVYLPVGYQQGWWLLSVIVVGGIAYALWRALRHDPLARFWAIGMGLALVVACTSQPGERLLWFVGIGGMGLLAQWMGKLWQTVFVSAGSAWCRRLAWSTLLALGLIHCLHAPIFLSREARLLAAGATITQAIDSLPADAAFRTQTAVIVNQPIFFYSVYALPARSLEAKPFPLRLRHLVTTFNAITITRPAANQLLIRPQGGFLTGGARLARTATMPIALGERFALTDMVVEVTAIDEQGQPTAARFTFATPLEDPALRWLTWDQATGAYVAFPLPAIGATIELPPLVEF